MSLKTMAVLSVATSLALVLAGCGSTSNIGGGTAQSSAGFGSQICANASTHQTGLSGARSPRARAVRARSVGRVRRSWRR